MADSPLIVKSKTFALEVIQVCKDLRVAKCESALINQFLRWLRSGLCPISRSPQPNCASLIDAKDLHHRLYGI